MKKRGNCCGTIKFYWVKNFTINQDGTEESLMRKTLMATLVKEDGVVIKTAEMEIPSYPQWSGLASLFINPNKKIAKELVLKLL